jgi:hypothetical protein
MLMSVLKVNQISAEAIADGSNIVIGMFLINSMLASILFRFWSFTFIDIYSLC